MRRRTALLLPMALVMGSSLTCRHELGTEHNPIKIMMVPSRDRGSTEIALRELARQLTGRTDLHFSVSVPERYIDLVVAVGDRRADLLLMNDMSYLLAHDEFNAHALLAVRRGDLEDHYRGVILTHRATGLKKLEELTGKRIAYVDVHSLSGYIMPAMMLRARGVTPAELVKAGTHDRVIELVYRREVDAGFSYSDTPTGTAHPRDGRGRLAQRHPDVYEEILVLGSTDLIPNEPVVFGDHVPQDVCQVITGALLSLVEDPAGGRALRDLNDITGLQRVTDGSYDKIRAALQGLGKKLDEMVPGGGLLELQRKERIEPVPPLGN